MAEILDGMKIYIQFNTRHVIHLFDKFFPSYISLLFIQIMLSFSFWMGHRGAAGWVFRGERVENVMAMVGFVVALIFKGRNKI